MLLNYLSLVILLVGLTLVFYTFIYIHDIPYMIAKKRDHPQKEAIHVACWLSLFTLHAIWPIVFIWAISKTGQPINVRVLDASATGTLESQLVQRIEVLEQRLRELSANRPAERNDQQ